MKVKCAHEGHDKRCVRGTRRKVPRGARRRDPLPAKGKYIRTRSVRLHHWGRLPLPLGHAYAQVHLDLHGDFATLCHALL
ncbi:hypothetical protein Taro_044287 [Colocasia esculenta]|uniref:Uncharacterized protein n=1 Tax=Colocasia esculenta TaxID=4460 RepID=A0A843X5A1_COLES|nr:hypothetical protein [Colocasia esculenta]